MTRLENMMRTSLLFAASLAAGNLLLASTANAGNLVPVDYDAGASSTALTKTYAQPAPSNGDRAVSNLQAALAAKGYYTGPENGRFTQDTMIAMVRYQHDNHLPEGRYTGETANALGITR